MPHFFVKCASYFEQPGGGNWSTPNGNHRFSVVPHPFTRVKSFSSNCGSITICPSVCVALFLPAPLKLCGTVFFFFLTLLLILFFVLFFRKLWGVSPINVCNMLAVTKEQFSSEYIAVRHPFLSINSPKIVVCFLDIHHEVLYVTGDETRNMEGGTLF